MWTTCKLNVFGMGMGFQVLAPLNCPKDMFASRMAHGAYGGNILPRMPLLHLLEHLIKKCIRSGKKPKCLHGAHTYMYSDTPGDTTFLYVAVGGLKFPPKPVNRMGHIQCSAQTHCIVQCPLIRQTLHPHCIPPHEGKLEREC